MGAAKNDQVRMINTDMKLRNECKHLLSYWVEKYELLELRVKELEEENNRLKDEIAFMQNL